MTSDTKPKRSNGIWGAGSASGLNIWAFDNKRSMIIATCLKGTYTDEEWQMFPTKEEARKNALLMAAAPDLFSALSRLLPEACKHLTDAEGQRLINKADKALKKAINGYQK